MEQKRGSGVNRRSFLKTASAATGLLIVAPETAFGTQANEKLRVGLIGCGQRGPWIADFFEQHTNSKVVAVCDYFHDKATAAGERFGVDEAHRFIGLDGYRGLIESGVDAVAVESAAYFHPEQAVAALEAGKHTYIAKPIAVDVPGCRAIVAAAKERAGELSVLVDFQTRNDEAFKKVAKGVHEGLIGTPVCGQAFFHGGRLSIRSKPGSETARIRNWFFDQALSGDVIVEQSIHMLDVANWYLQAHPVSAFGAGGRKARIDVGDAWDHFYVTYSYPDEVLLDFGGTQFLQGYSTLVTRLFGTEGTVDSHYAGEVVLKNREGGIPGVKTPQIYTNGAINNVKDFHASIVSGDYLDNTEVSAESTMTAILGRTAAYEGRTVTWDEMLAADTRLDPQLNLPSDGPYAKVEPV